MQEEFDDIIAGAYAAELNTLVDECIDKGILIDQYEPIKEIKNRFTKNQFKVIWQLMQSF